MSVALNKPLGNYKYNIQFAELPTSGLPNLNRVNSREKREEDRTQRRPSLCLVSLCGRQHLRYAEF